MYLSLNEEILLILFMKIIIIVPYHGGKKLNTEIMAIMRALLALIGEINSWEFDTSVEMISMVLSLHIEFMRVWAIVPAIVLRNYKAFHCPADELLIARHCASN